MKNTRCITSHRSRFRHASIVVVILLPFIHGIHRTVAASSGPSIASIKPPPIQKTIAPLPLATVALFNSRPDADAQPPTLLPRFTSGALSMATTIYGTALLLHGLPTFNGQVHVLTMMRVSGARKIEKGVETAKQNFHEALRVALRNAPSLYFATRSLRKIDARISRAHGIMSETRRVKSDGIVTRRETRQLAKKRRKYIRRLKGDAIRLRKASSSLGRVLGALDPSGMWEILQDFFVIMSTVMATGHSNGNVGKFICRYCHFLNLGSLIHEANRRIGFPISRLLWTGEVWDSDLDDEDHRGIAITGGIVSYAYAAYVLIYHNSFGLRLSAALLASAIILRGIYSLLGGEPGGRLEDLEFFRYKPDGRLLGVSMIALAAIGMRFSSLSLGGEGLEVHAWLYPLYEVEKVIISFLHSLESVV